MKQKAKVRISINEVGNGFVIEGYVFYDGGYNQTSPCGVGSGSGNLVAKTFTEAIEEAKGLYEKLIAANAD